MHSRTAVDAAVVLADIARRTLATWSDVYQNLLRAEKSLEPVIPVALLQLKEQVLLRMIAEADVIDDATRLISDPQSHDGAILLALNSAEIAASNDFKTLDAYRDIVDLTRISHDKENMIASDHREFSHLDSRLSRSEIQSRAETILSHITARYCSPVHPRNHRDSAPSMRYVAPATPGSHWTSADGRVGNARRESNDGDKEGYAGREGPGVRTLRPVGWQASPEPAKPSATASSPLVHSQPPALQRISIVGVTTNAAGLFAHSEYTCQVVLHSGLALSVTKRYKDFVALRETLVRKGVTSIPPLPEKKLIGKFSPSFLAARQAGLQKFLDDLIAIDPNNELLQAFALS